jgi:hypothetical protein
MKLLKDNNFEMPIIKVMIKMFISEELLTISRKSDPLEALKISQIK